MKIPSVEEMLKAGMHFGHSTSRWHPKMEPFIFTSRKGVYIIDLMKSRQMLETALEFIKKMTSESKQILFVGTKNQVKKPLKALAQEAGMAYVTEKWLGGFLTNFAIIRKTIRKYQDLLDNKNAGKLDKYTKKERLEIDREIARLEIRVGGLTNLKKLPDVLFIWDIKNEKTALLEARKKNIPVIAVCDTNANPEGVKYIIPANDDATKTIKLILQCVKEALSDGKKEIAAKA